MKKRYQQNGPVQTFKRWCNRHRRCACQTHIPYLFVTDLQSDPAFLFLPKTRGEHTSFYIETQPLFVQFTSLKKTLILLLLMAAIRSYWITCLILLGGSETSSKSAVPYTFPFMFSSSSPEVLLLLNMHVCKHLQYWARNISKKTF